MTPLQRVYFGGGRSEEDIEEKAAEIALQKQSDDAEKRKAIKIVAGAGIVGFLAWFIFGKKGSGGTKDGGGTPYDGSAGDIVATLQSDNLFHLASGAKMTTQQLIASAKQQNASLHLTVTGATRSGDYDMARTLLQRESLKVTWYDPSAAGNSAK